MLTQSTARSASSWERWPPEAKLRLLIRLQRRRWRCDRDECDGLPHEGWPVKHARTEQRPPDGDWRTWYLQGGRGSGKTRTGAETLADWIFRYDEGEGDWMVIAPTFGDAKEVCIEGHSGLLAALGGYPGPLVRRWNRGDGELELVNGVHVYIDGGNDGAPNIQGKNLRGAWCDEVGMWWPQWRKAWEESLPFAVRFEPARIIATGTPKSGHPLVAKLRDDPATVVTHMSMLANAANLHPEAVAEFLRAHPPGTRMYRQEIEGEFITDVVGALWDIDLIDRMRMTPEEMRVELADHGMTRVVVGVDPSGNAGDEAGVESEWSECGIVVAGWSSHTGRGYVLDDRSAPLSPAAWARVAVDAYHEHRADKIVAERNFGGEMVKAVIHTADPSVPVKLVTASRGKVARAEPISGLYERELVRHVGAFRELEDQMCGYVPDSGMDSPDRMDALVWALTELMVGGPRGARSYPLYGDDEEYVVRRGDLTLRGEHHRDK